MENISYIGLSQQIALRQEMDVTANNIANMNTPGFKANGVVFLEFLNRSRQDPDTIRQVSDISTYRNLSPGSMMQTHNTLDFAINGEGYFEVQTPDGPRYTRDGGFQLNEQRQLVNKSGYLLQGDGGPITIPPEAAQVHLTAGGTVHHIAFRVPDQKTQAMWRDELAAKGHRVTEILDRNYFTSIYFREPGGVLYEIATDTPGFDVDEPLLELGRSLKLPPWLEPSREAIEAKVAPLRVPESNNPEGMVA
jgi:flagellar hook-basal body protein